MTADRDKLVERMARMFCIAAEGRRIGCLTPECKCATEASAALDLALEEAARLTDEQSQVFLNEAHDQKVWGNGAMSKRALSIADFFAMHAAAIRSLKSKP